MIPASFSATMFKLRDIQKFTQGNGFYSTFGIQKSSNKTALKWINMNISAGNITDSRGLRLQSGWEIGEKMKISSELSS